MNKIIISGNLGKDAEQRNFDGKTVINFSVAVAEKVKGENKSTWFECSYWTEKTGILPYLTKGSKVLVDGSLGTREHNGKTYLTVRVNQVELIGGRNEQQQPVHIDPPVELRVGAGFTSNTITSDDDLPF